MTETREQIRAKVHENAGIHFNELVRTSDFAPGQTQYHIRKLTSDDTLVRREYYGRTHYYTPEYDEWERGTLALLRRETVREIVIYLAEHEQTTPSNLEEALDVARSTVEYHVSHLADQRIIEKRYDDKNHVLLTLARPEQTAHLMEVIIPTVPDRLVDRFTRLIDEILDTASDT